ncbi:ATP-binding cassette domain-containing protein [Pseudonocardia sp. DSM 110487]|uniref:branched-chain amino acid ABC transporter ATP-binding protein/permease n=1 Tax=Pseudonocardia sp. DSM 110487 TaxID=2865833 RepID=UPI0021081CA3|nr:branched-chain amino acid ABC transporter ATP-binding protein/permease [Pseudonocardia sp. DSM 110487]
MATLRRLPSWLLPLVLAVLLVAAPWLGISAGARRLLMLSCILALVASGLNLSFGYAGELALGQAAMYATGAYLSGYLAMNLVNDLAVLIVLSAVAALVVGLISGVPGLRLGGWSLAMTSFFLVLLVPQFIDLLEHYTGGAVGMVGIPDPHLFGRELSNVGLYVVVAVVTVGWFALVRNLITSRHGIAFQVLRASPVLASSLGISVYRLKLTAYAVGAIPAGIAGALFAFVDQYLAPHTFGFTMAVTVLAASILGGSMSVYGPLVGAAAMQYGPLRSTDFEQYSQIVYGIFLIIAGTLVANGLAGLARAAIARVEARWETATAPSGSGAGQLPPLVGARLEVVEVRKRFGGLHALRGVSLTAEPGRITALIGPNGSGKTTLLNMICGYYRTDAGSIRIGGSDNDGGDITGLPTHRVARAGVARTFQTPLFPRHISVREAVAAAAYAPRYVGMLASILRLPAHRRAAAADRADVTEVLRLVGVEHLADAEAASLPLGTRRLLEVARALMSRPKVLLLDEVASGLDEDEIERLAELIRKIRDAGPAVILVEHNFRLVLELADTIFVLAQGELVASGTPREIENHPRVLAEYLGVRQQEVGQ